MVVVVKIGKKELGKIERILRKKKIIERKELKKERKELKKRQKKKNQPISTLETITHTFKSTNEKARIIYTHLNQPMRRLELFRHL